MAGQGNQEERRLIKNWLPDGCKIHVKQHLPSEELWPLPGKASDFTALL